MLDIVIKCLKKTFTELSQLSFSSAGVLKRLLRSTARSLNSSSVSLPNSSEGLQRNQHKGRSKLGLSVIIEIPENNERCEVFFLQILWHYNTDIFRFLTQFIMEHIVFIEALIWRARHSLEVAYHRRTAFISLMMELTQNTGVWLVNVLSAPRIVTNVWRSLSYNCDILGSFNELNPVQLNSRRTFVPKTSSNSNGDRLQFSCENFRRRNSGPFRFNSIFKTDFRMAPDVGTRYPKDFIAEAFLKEFCELLEEFDVKHTNL